MEPADRESELARLPAAELAHRLTLLEAARAELAGQVIHLVRLLEWTHGEMRRLRAERADDDTASRADS